MWSNPVAWREAASRNATLPRILARWSFILAGLVGGAAVVGFFHSGAVGLDTFRALLLYTVLGEIVIIALVAVNMSATSITREREDGTLDLLLTTPITPRQYLSGKLRGMVAYLLPMLSVPLATLGMAGLYAGLVEMGVAQSPEPMAVAVRAAAGFSLAPPVVPLAPVMVPALLSEGVFSVALVSVPFIATCVMVGMSFSMRNKSVLTAVTQSIGVVAALSGVIGLCAWNAGPSVPLLGPVLGALSPASAVYAVVFPEHGLTYSFQSGQQLTPRLSLALGALIAALIQFMVVYSLLASMTRTFDATVRKLAGIK
ncbi:MAG: hypothetical protein C0468_05540 [Planctomyces sp.]|nr:hypothetical protein [Planctomyces sp.]